MEWIVLAVHIALAAVTVALSLTAAAHALLRKRDPRAAVLWVGFIAFAPLIGALMYFLFGINRIKRRARLLRGGLDRFQTAQVQAGCSEKELADALRSGHAHLGSLARAVSRVVPLPLLPGNRIAPLENGGEAYPAMVDAIRAARHTVALSVYIFDNDQAGRVFVQALGEAVRRGVDVRVLIDAAGTRYSWPPVTGPLRRAGVRCARFLPTFPLSGLLSINLRNHRKILVVDGRAGFTGGMNIRAGHWLETAPAHPVRDMHFRLEGPVVAHLQEAFTDDWLFTTGESLRGGHWFPKLESCGPTLARGVADGPDETFEALKWVLLSALTTARRSIRIATPYFLPEPTLVAALTLAALRGVDVHLLLPEKNNLPFVHWASQAQWWQVLEHGCRLWLAPPPFDHTKLFIVDEAWMLIGSTNWDPRSLRLNFEFNVECYDPALAERMAQRFDHRRAAARPVTLEDVDGRRFPIRMRDAAARLLAPFL